MDTIRKNQNNSSLENENLNTELSTPLWKSKKIIIGVVAAVVIVVGVFLFLYVRTGSIDETIIPEEIQGERFFHVTTLEWEPHVYTAEDGSVKGISADIVSLAFERLNIPYEIVLVPWTRSIKLVQEGEADAILVASFNQERTSFLHYTEKEQAYVIGGEEEFPLTSVGSAEISFFVRELNKESFAFDSLDELVEDQRRVGVPATYSYVPAVKRLGMNVVEYISPEEGFEKLASGEADMFLLERAVGSVLLKKMGLDDEIVYSASYSHIPLYMPFSKESSYPNVDEVRIKLAEEIKKIHESGEYDEIYDSYIRK